MEMDLYGMSPVDLLKKLEAVGITKAEIQETQGKLKGAIRFVVCELGYPLLDDLEERKKLAKLIVGLAITLLPPPFNYILKLLKEKATDFVLGLINEAWEDLDKFCNKPLN